MAEIFEAGFFNILDKATDTYHPMLAIKGDKGDPGPVASEETIRRVTSEEVAKVVAEAPEDFDTLKEISDWIATHADDASAMNSAIQTNASNIATNTTNIASNTNSIEHLYEHADDEMIALYRFSDIILEETNKAYARILAIRSVPEDYEIVDVGILYLAAFSESSFYTLTLEDVGQIKGGEEVTKVVSPNITAHLFGHGQRIGRRTVGFTARAYLKYRYQNVERVCYSNYIYGNVMDGMGGLTPLITGTLSAGETSIELTSPDIKSTSIIDPYFYATDDSETEPISYSTIKIENGKVTMTFDALDDDIQVGIRLS